MQQQIHRKSVSVDSKKPLNSTFRTTQTNTPKQRDSIKTKILTPQQQRRLSLYRKIFSRPHTSSVIAKPEINQNNEVFSKLPVEDFEFPGWLKNRSDFKNLKKMKYFSVEYKVLSICEMDQFNRSEQQKELIANYLRNLVFFRLMPNEMLIDIGGRLLAKEYGENQFICRKGDQADCLYIIYDGQVEVVEKNMKYTKEALFGGNVLDNQTTREISMKCLSLTHILILKRIDYQIILSNNMKIYSTYYEEFVKELPVFEHLSEDKIKKFCSAVQGKYMTPSDTLYKAGDLVDNFYILKKGTLIKQIVLDLEDSNRWPLNNKSWISKSITRTVGVDIEYKSGSLVGYYDILQSEFELNNKRLETIDAKEDCFLLYISKSKFFQIFSQNDIQFFHNYHMQHNPQTYEQIKQNTILQEQEARRKMHILNDAVYHHLRQFSYDYSTLQVKTKKYENVFRNSIKSFRQFKDKYRIIRKDQQYKVLTSQYQ